MTSIIFPHTPRHVTGGQNFDRDFVHYAFAEDIAALPWRLQQIVAASKGRYISPERIQAIIDSLDAMVIKTDGGTLPPPAPAAAWSSRQNWAPVTARPFQRTAPFPMRAGRGFQRFKRPASRLPRPLKIAVAVAVLYVAWNAIMTAEVAPVVQRSEPAPLTSEPRASKTNSPLPKPAGKGANTALPSFIAPAAAEAVERAIAAAQDAEVYVSWQSGMHHGLVILRSDDGDGCRRYQISRHDLPVTKYDTVRRCSEPRH